MASPDSAVWRVTHRGVARNQEVLNVTHWRVQNPTAINITTGQETQMIDTIELKWVNNIVGHLHEDYKYQESRLESILDSFDYQVPGTDPPVFIRRQRIVTDRGGAGVPGAEGLVVGVSMPLTVAVTVRMISGEHGRRKRGRMKLGPVGASDCDDDKFKPVPVVALDTALTTYINPFALTIAPNQVIEPCIFSWTEMQQGPAGLQARLFTVPVIDAKTQDILGTQRTRKLREGAL